MYFLKKRFYESNEHQKRFYESKYFKNDIMFSYEDKVLNYLHIGRFYIFWICTVKNFPLEKKKTFHS